MKKVLIGFVAGLIVATFAPKLADMARQGFDTGRDFAGSAVEQVAESARP